MMVRSEALAEIRVFGRDIALRIGHSRGKLPCNIQIIV